jgi:hypothetical protein
MHVALLLALAFATAEPGAAADDFCSPLRRYVDDAPRDFMALRDPEDPGSKRPLSQSAYSAGPATRTVDEVDTTVRIGDASCTIRPGARSLSRARLHGRQVTGSVEDILSDEPYGHCKWTYRDVAAAHAQYAALIANVARCMEGFDKNAEESADESAEMKTRVATRFSRSGAPDVLVRLYPTSWRETTVAIDVFIPVGRRDRRR